MRSSFIPTLVFALLTLLALVACSSGGSPVSPAAVEGTPSGLDAQLQLTPSSAPVHETGGEALALPANSDCQVGQILTLRERCAYPGTTDEFWVDDSGAGNFLFFTASSVINAQNANINSQNYDFAARKQGDGNWIIEIAGIPSNAVKVADLVVAAVPSPVAVSSAPSQARMATPLPSPTPTLVPSPAPASGSQPTPTPEPSPTPDQPASVNTPERVPLDTPTVVASPESTSTSTDDTTPTPNIPPKVVASVGEQTVVVDNALVLDVSYAFADPEGEGVERYSVLMSNPSVGHGRINSVTGELTLSGLMAGSSWVAVSACDPHSCAKIGALTFMLVVTPHDNRPPQAVKSVAEQEVRVGETISLDVRDVFWDVEGDSIVGYEILLDNKDLAAADVNVDRAQIVFVGVQTGSTSVLARACDADGCGAEMLGLRFPLTVLPARNQLPYPIADIADKGVYVSETITLDVSHLFADPEGDPIHEYGFSIGDKSIAVGAIDPRSGVLAIRGAKSGRTLVAVDASDGNLETVREDLSFWLTVSEPPRRPPTIVAQIPDETVEVGSSIEVSVAHAFYAPRRYRIIRYDYLLRNPEISVDIDITNGGVLTLKGSETGRTWVSVRACNYLGCSDFTEAFFALIVTDPDEELNQSPEVVGGVADRILKVGESFTADLSAAFEDPENDRIEDYKATFSSPYRVTGSSITDTGVIVIQGAHTGVTTVYISACDDEDNCSDPEDLQFTVTVVAAD